jgi:hypothetical protein
MLIKAKDNLSLHRRLGIEDSGNNPELDYTDDEEDEVDLVF